jgi:hypothetical protein
MIVDQLFTPKPLEEGGPYDLPGKDYDRPGDTPRKQSSDEHNHYPYSPEEDDDYFREIFRKKREAKDQGVAEGPTDDPRFQKMMGNIQKSTPKYVPVTGYVAVSFASEQGSKKIKGVSRNGKPIPTNIGDPDQFLSGKIEFTPDQVEQQLMSIGKKYGWDSIDSGQSQGFTEMFFDTAKEYTSNNYPYLATNIVKTVREINKFFADINKSLQTTGLPGYVSDVWQGMGPPENTNQIEDLDQIISIAKKTAAKADPGPEIGKVILANYERFGGEDGYSRSELDQAAKIAKIYITQGERAGFQAQHNSDVSDLIDELLSDAGSDVRTIYTDDPLNPMQIEEQGMAEGDNLATFEDINSLRNLAGLPVNENVLTDSTGSTLEHIKNTFKRDVKDFTATGEMSNHLFRSLYDYYFDDMPYGAKTGDDIDPHEWVSNRFSSDLGIDENLIAPMIAPVTTEGSTCNMTAEGEYCPEHGLVECGGMYEMGTVAGGMGPVIGEGNAVLARIKFLALLK